MEKRFKAWDKKKKKWVEWAECEIFINHSMDDAVFFLHDNSLTGYDDFEVVQFTGLKDKTGTEIYEGDEIQVCGQWGCAGGIVKYDADMACFIVADHDGSVFFRDHFPDVWELTGKNIYENPELLEG